jgi:hypothetical protein
MAILHIYKDINPLRMAKYNDKKRNKQLRAGRYQLLPATAKFPA